MFDTVVMQSQGVGEKKSRENSGRFYLFPDGRILLLVVVFVVFCSRGIFSSSSFCFSPPNSYSLVEWTGSLVPPPQTRHRRWYYSRKWIERPEYVECQTFSLSSGFASNGMTTAGRVGKINKWNHYSVPFLKKEPRCSGEKKKGMPCQNLCVWFIKSFQ